MAIRPLSDDLKKLAKDINEDEKRIPEDINAIKIWLKKQPHLNARLDDQWILTFLRGCKFSLERTKEKLDTYYTYKTLLPEFFKIRDPFSPEIQELLKLGNTVALPKPDKHGRHIMVIRIGINDPKKHNINDLVRFNFINMDRMLLDDDRNVIAGMVVILDVKGLSFDHIRHFTPALMKKCVSCYQDAYPIRPQAIHYVNTTPVFESAFKIIKTFMKKKLQDRLIVHGADFKKLYEYLPKDLLPADFGGDLPKLDELAVDWRKSVEKHRDWFVEDFNYRSDEKKRPGKPKTTSDVFGLEGSFRALELD